MSPKTILLTRNISDLKAFEQIYANDEPESEKELDDRREKIASQIENGNVDFVVSALKPLGRCPEKVSLTIKNGVLCGLNRIPYREEYIASLCGWFSYESDECKEVLFRLLDYFIENYQQNKREGSFLCAIKDALNDEVLAQHIAQKIGMINK